MFKTSVRFALASVAAGSLVTLASAPAMAYQHLTWANAFITNATINEAGDDCSINWTAMSGYTLGAGFFTATLKQAMGWSEADISSHWGMFCPTSPTYFTAIGNGQYFTQISNIANVQAGDVIVVNSATGFLAGHTMVVAAPPVEITHQISPIYAGTRQWKVRIVDATRTSHGCTDPRWIGTCVPVVGYTEPGAAEANMRLYSDTTVGNVGKLLGHTWSVTSSMSSYYSPMTRPYRIGRLTALMPAAPPPPPPPPPPP